MKRSFALHKSVSQCPNSFFRRILCSRADRVTQKTITNWVGTSNNGDTPRLLLTSSRINATRLYSTQSNKEGLFSIPNLRQPNDFLTLANEAISKSNSLRESLRPTASNNNIYVSNTTQAKETLATLDEISNTICSVIDASELCRSVHVDEHWRNAAGQAFQLLSEYIAELNADVNLFQSLIPITSSLDELTSESGQAGSWTAEDTRFAMAMKREFERDGIHLRDDQRTEIQKLSGFVVQLESLFTQNTYSNEMFDVENEMCSDVMKVVPRQRLEQAIPQSNQEENAATLSTDPLVVNTLLRYSSSSSLRKEVYMQNNTSCPQNMDVLDALIANRHELSSKLGYESYAHYFLSDKMAQTPENVNHFLNSITEVCSGQYKHDMELLQNIKNQVEGTIEPLKPWDMNYYTGMVKANMTEKELSSSVAGYFTVEQSIKSMKILVQKLFGIVMQEMPIQEEERWDILSGTTAGDLFSDSSNIDSISSLQKFEFVEEDSGQKLGTLYFDLFPRDGKYGHNAHFTVRCGCKTRSFVNGGITQHEDYQLPIVALVCNLSPPSISNAAILSHSEVETLFHEFGHALHSLLSRTSYQHLSGTRAAMDFVETPSHLIEHFVWDKNFLHILGRHHVTGEPMSPDLVENLIKGRNVFKSCDVQTQAVYAKFDQTIFGDPTLWKGKGMSTMDVFTSLHHDHKILYADGTHWYTRFGHLVTYGAGYYSYLYCSYYAADLWKTCFDGGGSGALNRDIGLTYWKEMLIHGGSKDPNVMLETMLGREPRVNSFLEFLE